MSDPLWQAGATWGEPRPAHPEGTIEAHIEDVIRHLDLDAPPPDVREKLRLVALLHDTFKREVDHSRPTVAENHHARLARHFAERYVSDVDVLDIVELHDEAFNAWRAGRNGNWPRAQQRANALIERLGPRLPLYLRFYRADNASGDKDPLPLEWFENLARARAQRQ